MNLCPGDLLAQRYRVKRRIGGGSFGEIFLGMFDGLLFFVLNIAIDTKTQIEVAIKTVSILNDIIFNGLKEMRHSRYP